MPRRRIQRLNEQLKREISGLIRSEVHDPRVGIVTVTGVEATPDLQFAKVHVRPMADDEAEKKEALEGLDEAAGYIRHALGKTLHLRRVPELHFQLDQTLEKAMRIEEILDEVKPDDGWDAEEDPDDGAPEGDAGGGAGP